MPTQHHVRLTNSTSGTYDFYPTTSPLTVVLSAQSSGSYFNYGEVFANVLAVLMEADNNQAAILKLVWPSATNPNWGMQCTGGSTSCTVTVLSGMTKFTFALPDSGQESTFQLTPAAGPHAINATIRRR